jgi:hypothetical protein
MDPNTTLDEITRILDRCDANMSPNNEEDARRLAELVDALDEWLRSGGFLPRDWELCGKNR